jgi:chorismate dehydratase
LSHRTPTRLRVAAINFLNPAPLMWDFEHQPLNSVLAERYQLHSTRPAQCAVELLEGRADLGLIPIAALTPELAIVPGCTIASLDRVRSIQLIVKLNGSLAADADRALAAVRSVAADTASRSSLAYAQILFKKFIGTDPTFLPVPADPIAMLAQADAALLIGDPALLALEARTRIEAATGPCLWLDLAHEWITRTGHPWIAAVWAVRPEALVDITPTQLTTDLEISRNHGLAHIDRLVEEWTPRIAIPPATIRHYLTHNIHYSLTPACIESIRLFRNKAAEAGALPALPNLRFL